MPGRPPLPVARLPGRTCPQQTTNLPAESCPGHPLAGRAALAGRAVLAGRASRPDAKERTRAAPSDRRPSRWLRAWPPLSTGCPGPSRPNPRPAGGARQAFLPVPAPRLAQGPLAADTPPWHGPDRTNPSARLASPVLDWSATYPRSRQCQPRAQPSCVPVGIIQLRLVTNRFPGSGRDAGRRATRAAPGGKTAGPGPAAGLR